MFRLMPDTCPTCTAPSFLLFISSWAHSYSFTDTCAQPDTWSERQASSLSHQHQERCCLVIQLLPPTKIWLDLCWPKSLHTVGEPQHAHRTVYSACVKEGLHGALSPSDPSPLAAVSLDLSAPPGSVHDPRTVRP